MSVRRLSYFGVIRASNAHPRVFDRAILERDNDHLALPQPAAQLSRAADRALDLPGHEGGFPPVLPPRQPFLLIGQRVAARRAGCRICLCVKFKLVCQAYS